MSIICAVSGAISLGLAAVLASPFGRAMVVRNTRGGRTLLRCLVALFVLDASVNFVAAATGADGVMTIAAVSTLMVSLSAALLILGSRRISPAAPIAPRRFLVVGAHPDDLEIACGAALARLVDSGHEVHAVIMSHGAVGGDASTRPGEALAGARFIGLSSVAVHDLPDTALSLVDNEMIRKIEAAIDLTDPHVILTHSSHDQHQDHYAVHQATLRAARQHHSILCYESPSTTRDFNPSVFIDVEDYVDVKVEAVLAHRDQAGKPYMTPDALTGIATFRGR